MIALFVAAAWGVQGSTQGISRCFSLTRPNHLARGFSNRPMIQNRIYQSFGRDIRVGANDPSKKPGESPLAGGMLNPAYWKLEYIKAEMFKLIPNRYKVLLVGSGAARDAFYFPKEAEVTLEGLTVRLQDIIAGGGSDLPKLQVTKSLNQLPTASFDVVVTAGEYARIMECKLNPTQWLGEVERVLKPDGRILFLEPVKAGLSDRLQDRYPAVSLEMEREKLLGPLGAEFEYGAAMLNVRESDMDRAAANQAGFGAGTTGRPKKRKKKK
ncbi:hypothetical protein AAMO2058_001759100 [Amorphochlora amoebiformis]